jgi:hypothetical protein
MRALANVSVRHDVQRAIAEIQGLRADVEEKATVRALNHVLNRVATETGREIRKVYNVKLKAITAALKKHRANRKHLRVRLVVEGVRLNLIEFSARAVNPWNVKGRRHRRRGGGVSVQIKVAGGRKIVQGAFITASTANNATGGGSEGMRQVWRRRNTARDSMVTLRSVSVPQAFSNEAVLAALRTLAAEGFHTEFNRQIRVLSGPGGR